MKEYGKFICLTAEAEKYFSKMSEGQLDLYASLIAHNVNETRIKLQNDYFERSQPKHKSTSDIS